MAELVEMKEIWNRYKNKYEAIVVASRYARELSRRKVKLERKPIVIALRKLVKGEIEYWYKTEKKRSEGAK
ncbi:MAG: DNA-directed RNA polymerase subunit omega [Candidatus Hydrothermota bacterium]|nr:MAG: DNA-directed RNA polymerase subunit omega [Candidatus Hydrothermae bacterium]